MYVCMYAFSRELAQLTLRTGRARPARSLDPTPVLFKQHSASAQVARQSKKVCMYACMYVCMHGLVRHGEGHERRGAAPNLARGFVLQYIIHVTMK